MLPDDPLDFLGKNVLLVGKFERSGLFWAKLEGSDGVYKLVDAKGEGSGAFPIYWCHYSRDKVHIIALQDQATLMFTPRMSGCTFAAGVPASDGTVVVGHANIEEGTEFAGIREIDQAMSNRKLKQSDLIKLNAARQDLVMQKQREMLSDSFGPIGIDQSLDRNNKAYANSTEITTFGVRTGKAWAFYFQARRGNSKGGVTGVYPLA